MDYLTSRYKYISIIILVISIPLAYFAAIQKHNNQLDVYFEEDNPDYRLYKRFQETYGNEEMAMIVFRENDILSNENIRIVRDISNPAA